MSQIVFTSEKYASFHYKGFTVEDTSICFLYNAVEANGDCVAFVETVSFGQPVIVDTVLESIVNLLGVALGLSYYKMFAGKPYVIECPLTVESVSYVESLVTYGLAEFAYVNRLDGLVKNVVTVSEKAPTVSIMGEVREGLPLVSIGGGKDSIVSVEALRSAGLDFYCFTVNASKPHFDTVSITGKEHYNVLRVCDSKLFSFIEAGALAGHVPVTAFNSLIGVVESYLVNGGVVLLSNELSADVETLVWGGEKVNHQWAKSYEAEVLLNKALASVTGYSYNVVSILKPYMEIDIAKAYANNCEAYDSVVVSCNKAYRIGKETGRWCGACDKCRFVGLMFAPFMSKDKLYSIVGFEMFSGNVQDYMSLVNGFDKPFECVGDVAEAREAFMLLSVNPEWGTNDIVVEVCKYIVENPIDEITAGGSFTSVSPYNEAVGVFFG